MYKRAKIRDLVKLKGGTAHVARLCGVTSASVSQWSNAGSIPAKHARTLAREWGCNPDILHNPWGWRADYLTENELLSALSGGGDEELLIDDDEVIEWRAPDPSEWDDEPYVKPPVERGRVPTQEELDAILEGMNNDREG